MTETMEIKVDKFTFKVAVDRLYTAEGVWALAGGSIVRLGLSDYLQQRSGDIAFVEVKPAGTLLKFGDEFSSIETIKVDILLASPVSGKVVRVNPALESTPDVINLDPYGEGWLCEVELNNWSADRPRLLDHAAYFAKIKREAEEEVRRK
jgi:glycine cleavage system H protein